MIKYTRWVCIKCDQEKRSYLKPIVLCSDGKPCIFKPYPEISEKMKEKIQKMASRTWDAIGDDCLRLLDEGETSMPRDQVLELVMDRMDVWDEDPEALKVFREIPGYQNKIEILKPAFPYLHYSW